MMKTEIQIKAITLLDILFKFLMLHNAWHSQKKEGITQWCIKILKTVSHFSNIKQKSTIVNNIYNREKRVLYIDKNKILLHLKLKTNLPNKPSTGSCISFMSNGIKQIQCCYLVR